MTRSESDKNKTLRPITSHVRSIFTLSLRIHELPLVVGESDNMKQTEEPDEYEEDNVV